jgi:hypothetical protein
MDINAGERVVILIDEYDKPMIDNMRNKERSEERRVGKEC